MGSRTLRSWPRLRACAPRSAAVEHLRRVARVEWQAGTLFDLMAAEVSDPRTAGMLRGRAEQARRRAAQAAADAGRLARRIAQLAAQASRSRERRRPRRLA